MVFDLGNLVPANIARLVLVVVMLASAGCVSTTTPGDPSTTPQCTLIHEVVSPSDDYVDASETYAYEELSRDAQRAFETALDRGNYSTTDRNLTDSEFRYWGTTTSYNITYQNETYKLLTYSGEGCNE